MDEEAVMAWFAQDHARFMFFATFRYARFAEDINDQMFIRHVIVRWKSLPVQWRYLIARDLQYDVFDNPESKKRLQDKKDVWDNLEQLFTLYVTDQHLIPYRNSIFR